MKGRPSFLTEGRCYIIAEAGINHNGSLALAKQLVDAAASAGVDAVKFQTFKTEDLVTDEAKQATYQQRQAKAESQSAMLRKLELDDSAFTELKEYCAQKNIQFLSTPHSGASSVAVLEKLEMPFYKIGSGDLTNIPFLSTVGALKKPIILSTGMATLAEIKEGILAVEAGGGEESVLLQCSTLYPCPDEKANIRAMQALANLTPHPVGFSDHTRGTEAGIVARCLGAELYEKHFTLDRTMEGPDHAASIEPQELARLVMGIRFVEKHRIIDPAEAFARIGEELGLQLDKARIEPLLGSAEKEPDEEELKIALVVRKSIIAQCDITAGETFSSENLIIKRPGTGLHPREWKTVLGRTAARNLTKDTLLREEDIQ